MRVLLTIIIVTISAVFPTVYAQDWETLKNESYTLGVGPKGLYAGEPTKGVLFSGNFGQSFANLGLTDRWVTGIKYYNGGLFASTYYTVDNTSGLFMSFNDGYTWEHKGASYSASSVSVNSHAIYLGTYSHGLHVSYDLGATWKVKLSNDPQINLIESSEDLVFAATNTSFYVSRDLGDTFEKINYLEGKTINSVLIEGNLIWAGGTGGFFISEDQGHTWTPIESYPDSDVRGLVRVDTVIYAAGREDIYFSPDNGVTWNKTFLALRPYERVKSLVYTVSEHSYLFVATTDNIFARLKLENKGFENLPLFANPYGSKYPNLLDRITSFFDHTYPFLGYQNEPLEEQNTTTNFYGIKESEPKLYYSSHTGTDFALPYGTEILAVSSGMASYYFCQSCGHTIKIDHQNGFYTSYMHLQDTGLITKTGPIFVQENQVIGKVGMTGKTTGPHLHFSATRGNQLPNDFTDPFGWRGTYQDPWTNYGGDKSLYLWKTPTKEISQNITQGAVIKAENITFDFSDNFLDTIQKFVFKPYAIPQIPEPLKYLPNTSFLAQVYDQTGKLVKNFEYPIQISVDITGLEEKNILVETLKIYHFNETSQMWESLPTILDLISKKLIGTTTHFSKFAVFAEKVDGTSPMTIPQIEGTVVNGWYVTKPTVSFFTDETAKTYYTLDNEQTWKIYQNPFIIDKEGITTLLYRSEDTNENLEETRELNLKVNYNNNFTDKVTVDVSFKIMEGVVSE